MRKLERIIKIGESNNTFLFLGQYTQRWGVRLLDYRKERDAKFVHEICGGNQEFQQIERLNGLIPVGYYRVDNSIIEMSPKSYTYMDLECQIMIPCCMDSDDEPLDAGFPIAIKFEFGSRMKMHFGLVFTTLERLYIDILEAIKFKEQFHQNPNDELLYREWSLVKQTFVIPGPENETEEIKVNFFPGGFTDINLNPLDFFPEKIQRYMIENSDPAYPPFGLSSNSDGFYRTMEINGNMYAIEKLELDPLSDLSNFTQGFYKGNPWQIYVSPERNLKAINAFKFSDKNHEVLLAKFGNTLETIMDLSSEQLKEDELKEFQSFLHQEIELAPNACPVSFGHFVTRHIYVSEVVDQLDFMVKDKFFFEELDEKLEEKLQGEAKNLIDKFKTQ